MTEYLFRNYNRAINIYSLNIISCITIIKTIVEKKTEIYRIYACNKRSSTCTGNKCSVSINHKFRELV